MEELVEQIFEMLQKNLVGFIVEQCHIIKHVCIRNKTDLVGLNAGPRGLGRVQVQQVDELGGIPHRLPSQNVQVSRQLT